MNKIAKYLILVCFGITNAYAIELIQWDKIPIKLTVNQDDERIIIIDKNVSVGLPSYLQDKVRIQSLGGVLYIKSSEPFEETRLMIKDSETGEIILLDLTGNKKSRKKLETVKIVFDGDVQSSENSGIVGAQENYAYEQETPLPIQLTRYAAQSFYAPVRTIEKVRGITQIPVAIPDNLTKLIPSLPVTANPLAAWRLGEYEVIAIKLTNQSDRLIKLDPRLLQGNFYAATFQHNTLGEKGLSTDTTMAYVVVKGKSAIAFLKEPLPIKKEKSGE